MAVFSAPVLEDCNQSTGLHPGAPGELAFLPLWDKVPMSLGTGLQLLGVCRLCCSMMILACKAIIGKAPLSSHAADGSNLSLLEHTLSSFNGSSVHTSLSEEKLQN